MVREGRVEVPFGVEHGGSSEFTLVVRRAAASRGGKPAENMPRLHAGLTHVQYGHSCRPRDIEVRCPRCGALAIARKPSEAGGREIVGDLSPSWALDDWEIVCLGCPFRTAGLAYDVLPTLFWTFEVGRLVVWAWNREHLAFIRRHLIGESTPTERYAWLGTYIPGDWKASAQRVARAIETCLAK